MHPDSFRLRRRSFLKLVPAGLVGGTLVSQLETAEGRPKQADGFIDSEPIALAEGVERTWLGPEFWANRLQDWRLGAPPGEARWSGRIECVASDRFAQGRTVAVLTHEVVPGEGGFRIEVQTGTLSEAPAGFSGFLIGAGAGELDYRSAALVGRSSGVGGGMFCTYEADGSLKFREHTDEERPFLYEPIPADDSVSNSRSARTADEHITLRLEAAPEGDGTYSLFFSAWDGERLLGEILKENVPERDLLGGIMLVSSAMDSEGTARYWFRDLRIEGEKIAYHPERAMGPVLGAMYTTSRRPRREGAVLRMTAQLFPIGPIGDDEPAANSNPHAPREAARHAERDAYNVRLDIRENDDVNWREAATAEVGAGWTACFEVPSWDDSRDWQYRIALEERGETRGGGTREGGNGQEGSASARPRVAAAAFTGTIRRDPRERNELVIALYSCSMAVARSLDGGGNPQQFPFTRSLGRYTRDCLYVPHAEVVENSAKHRPDLLAFCGDQLYEGNPTNRDSSETPTLDYLYKYYLWMWSFRDLLRGVPSVVLVDDHDVYHGNLWGHAGRAAPGGDINAGGYRCSAEFVNVVERTQCRHNPPPYDPEPVERGISVYYTGFQYGGVSFALLEDRKFKTCPGQPLLLIHEAELLGPRQEAFLAEWTASDRDLPKVCITQTVFAAAQTSPRGAAYVDFDANGYPKPKRDLAIDLLRRAGAIMLSGDQHLAMLVRHGIDTFTDGVVQFSGPATATSWQRWFEPREATPNGREIDGETLPYTGDWIDGFGNKLRMLAVANPKIPRADYARFQRGHSNGLNDRALRSEGYGIVRVEKANRRHVFECWEWNVDPSAADARQFAGWPYVLPFDECDGRGTGR